MRYHSCQFYIAGVGLHLHDIISRKEEDEVFILSFCFYITYLTLLSPIFTPTATLK